LGFRPPSLVWSMKENMNKESKELFLSDEERGITDRTTRMANDCFRIQNAPVRGEIMAWWIKELEETGEDPEILAEWKRQIEAGEARLG